MLRGLKVGALLKIAVLVTIVLSPFAHADPKGEFLGVNQFLGSDKDDYLTSSGGTHFAIMQGDGNLAVYRGSDPGHNQGFVWGSIQVGQYAPKAGSYFAVMQGDGNLAVYRGSDPSHNQGFVWGSVRDGGYAPKAGSYFAIMQGDGNLAVYRGSDPGHNQGFVWGSIQSLTHYQQQQQPHQPPGCHWVWINPCATTTSPGAETQSCPQRVCR
jgi:hypothetical protein